MVSETKSSADRIERERKLNFETAVSIEGIRLIFFSLNQITSETVEIMNKMLANILNI